jgi:hypothetical protein
MLNVQEKSDENKNTECANKNAGIFGMYKLGTSKNK